MSFSKTCESSIKYWEQSQWDRDLKKMAEMGFTFTHFAEFAWSRIEPMEGVYNWDWLDCPVLKSVVRIRGLILITFDKQES